MRISPVLISALSLSLSLTACSDKQEQAQGYSKPDNAAQGQAAMPMDRSNMPAGHPGSNMPMGHPGGNGQAGGGQPAPLLNKELHPGSGIVKSATHASGYTYMELDMDGKTVWIAATAMKVKSGQKVQWQDGAMMRNFPSKTLHRTFDEILFVSNASVAQ